MFYIGEVPAELKRFFAATGTQGSKPHQYCLTMATLAAVVGFGRRNAKAIWAMLDPRPSRAAFNDFFTAPRPCRAQLSS
jgi:hypothetical protein